MNKLLLSPVDLRVESFPTAPARGAVVAHGFTVGLNCPETNYRTCPHTCAVGC